MAYGLKYTQYISKGNTTLRINVYAKDWAGATYGMAHILGASLQIVGGQADIISPIIKTSFSWSLADAWDQGTAQADGTTCVNAQGEKCGRWEEFYTKDATKFRVEVLNGSTVIWRGYVTPDSWTEEMQFHGSVTITARDMLGALQDVEFDLTGRVTVLDVVQGALEACSCPMELYYVPAHFLVNENGQSILAHDFAASTFSGRNWYQALEDTLHSLGLVLRYNGAGQIVLTSLRYLSADTLQGHHEVAYANRSGLRSLDPALKLITETFDVDFEERQAGDPETTQFSPTGEDLTQKVVAKLDSGATVTNTHAIPAYNLTQEGGEGWSGTLAVPQIGTAVDGAPDRKIYFPTDIQESVEATWYGPRLRGAFSFRIAMDGSVLERATRSGQIILRPPYNPNRHFVDQLTIRVEADVNGTVKYLSSTGSWETVSGTLNVEPNADVVVPDSGGTGIRIVILSIRTANTLPAYNALFAPINLITEPAEGAGVVQEYKTTTNYDQENNVTVSRSPVIGSADQEGCIDFFPNLLGYGDVIAPDKWNWPGEASFFHLAVMIQAQVLCYYAAAASVFTGTAVDRAADFALPGYAFDYYSRRGVPVSGVYDLASGFAMQSTVREVYSWEEVWGESFAPEYTQKSGSGKGSTSATGTGGSSASGGSSGGGGGTSVNYFELAADPTLVQLRQAYSYLGVKDGLLFTVNANTYGEGDTEPDLYVKTVDGTRVLYSPLPLITKGDQIVINGTPGGGGGGGVDHLYLLEDVYGNFTTGRVKTAAGADVSDGQALVWNTSLGKWVAGTVGGGSTYSAGTAIEIANDTISVSGTLDTDPISFDPDTHAGVDPSNPVAWGAASGPYGIKLSVNGTVKDLVLVSGYNALAARVTALEEAPEGGVTEIDGHQGAITLGSGLAMNGNQLYVTGQTAGTVTRVYVGSTAYNPDSSGYVSLPAYPTVPTAVSAFTNDAGYVTASVNNLTNYYKKTETYTREEVNSLIGSISGFSYVIAASTSAVTNPQSNVLYLIGPTGSGADKYQEYVYPNSTTGWVKIGDTSIDLSGYVNTLSTSGSGNYVSAVSKSGSTLTVTYGTLPTYYTKPSGGIPKTDLASAVQTSLGRADTALQSSSLGRGFGIALSSNTYSLSYDSVSYANERAITFDPDTHSGVDPSNPVAWGSASGPYGIKLSVNSVVKDLVLVSGYNALAARVTALEDAPEGGITRIGTFQGAVTLGANLSITENGVLSATDTTYGAATTSAAGLMSAADKTKLNGIAEGATAVSDATVSGWGYAKTSALPGYASGTTAGIIKIGTGLAISDSGVVSVTGQTQGTVTRVDVGGAQYGPSASGVVSLPAYPTTLPASDVYSWAKAASKPEYAFSEISGTASASQIPTLAISKISGLQNALDGKQPLDADLTAIAGLTGTSGFLVKTAENAWALDTNTYLTAHQTIYQLVINNYTGTAQITYRPATSGNYALTLTKAMVGLSNVPNWVFMITDSSTQTFVA